GRLTGVAAGTLSARWRPRAPPRPRPARRRRSRASWAGSPSLSLGLVLWSPLVHLAKIGLPVEEPGEAGVGAGQAGPADQRVGLAEGDGDHRHLLAQLLLDPEVGPSPQPVVDRPPGHAVEGEVDIAAGEVLEVVVADALRVEEGIEVGVRARDRRRPAFPEGAGEAGRRGGRAQVVVPRHG